MCAASALMLTGCATSSGNPKLITRLPDHCERHAVPVTPPAVSADRRYFDVAAEALAGLKTANKRLKATRECEARLREREAR